MDARDLQAVQYWLRAGLSLADVESLRSEGLVGNLRFSPCATRLFAILWRWSAPRFSGDAGEHQDRYYHRRGASALARRLTRCQHHIQRLQRM